MKTKILSVVLIFLLVFATAGVCCEKGGESGTGKNDSSSGDSSSQGDTGHSNSSSDSNSNSDSGDSFEGDRNGLPRDCDPWGITGPLCPKDEVGESND
jgi:hypothetical protein